MCVWQGMHSIERGREGLAQRYMQGGAFFLLCVLLWQNIGEVAAKPEGLKDSIMYFLNPFPLRGLPLSRFTRRGRKDYLQRHARWCIFPPLCFAVAKYRGGGCQAGGVEKSRLKVEIIFLQPIV